MIKKIIIFVVIVFALFLFFDSANAETISMTSNNSFFGVSIAGQSDFPYFTYSSAYGNNSLYDQPLYLYNYNGLSRPYKYLIASVCTNSEPKPYIYGSGFSNNYVLYNTGKDCIANNYNGSLFLLQIAISEYEDFDGTGEELVAAGRLQFLWSVDWTPFVQFIDWSLSSDDLLTNVAQNQEQIDALLDKQNETNQKLDELGNKQDETNNKLDEIKDMDISDEDKELPNDDAYQDYTEAEDDLLDKVNEADMDALEIAIDEDSSNFVWDTLTDLITSHTLIFGTVIAILSIGIIKLALGR